MRLHAGHFRALAGAGGRHEQIEVFVEVAGDRRDDAAHDGEAAAELALDARLRDAQIQVARAEQIGERQRGERRRVARREHHVILTNFERGLFAVEARECVEQAREAHHLTGVERGRAAEEVDDQPRARFRAADFGAVDGQADAALAERGAERSRPSRDAAETVDDVGIFEPVGFVAVVERVRQDGAEDFDGQARIRLHFHLRQLLHLRLQHGDGRGGVGRQSLRGACRAWRGWCAGLVAFVPSACFNASTSARSRASS